MVREAMNKDNWKQIVIGVTLIVYCTALLFSVICYLKQKETSSGAPVGCGAFEGSIPKFILNGTVAPLNFVPWYVALKHKPSRSPHCGGSILSEDWVVSAKHCVYCNGTTGNIDCLIIVAGSQDSMDNSHGTIHNVIDIIGYGNLTETQPHDIVLLKVSPKFVFRNKNLEGNKRGIAPICLPEENEAVTEKEAIASGFGLISEFFPLFPQYLMTVAVDMYPLDACKNIHFGGDSMWRQNILICAGLSEHRKASCSGDSGGPLTVVRRNKATLIGVTHATKMTGCEQFVYYMNVSHYYSWINKQTSI